ncbi:coenzyme PQQ synthesis protein F [Pseudomonas asuensis]|uniref:Coenzyme PQQ synthesis protein F n=1 Tax=Pseudomonas asuensis TaxID=1825787 RepID=A0ABQ2GVB5_9PSED|nr:pyrroloquinoline quinone biosynthesis protein PqqF [Pseudomonas asuensis]GGM15244.1 coenzyme PQQ synthesis protein F [Pseudomonas asuensis]
MNNPSATSLESFRLPNGLTVILAHVPRLKRTSAAIRIAAGSHDVDRAWPGLAHFLEHLLFLGTDTYPADEGLMPYVQRHAGQVNASTGDRLTDFFFEVPPVALEGGLIRLCDMLAHPHFALEGQRREREVIHAEFIAWSRDIRTHRLAWMMHPLSRHHPARAFHAGNRYSLLVPNTRFQTALKAFHARFYQAGQMTLALVGPQPLDELRQLAVLHGSQFNTGEHVQQTPPPALLPAETVKPIPLPDANTLGLMFALESLPAESSEAIDCLSHWMHAEHDGGLIDRLRKKGWIKTLKLETLYRFEQQAVLAVEIALTEAGAKEASQVARAFFDWLAFLKRQPDWTELQEEYTRLAQQARAISGALALSRSLLEHGLTSPGLSDAGVIALQHLLSQLRPEHNLLPIPDAPEHNAEPVLDWRLPPLNPFLTPALTKVGKTPVSLPALVSSQALSPDHGEGALYICWRFPEPVAYQPALIRTLNHALRVITDQARQAGVDVSLSTLGQHWQLRITGLSNPIPAVLDALIPLLHTPGHDVWRAFSQPPPAPNSMPIRQLMSRFDDLVAEPPYTAADQAGQSVEGPALLASLWSTAQWHGLAIGFSDATLDQLRHCMLNLPGTTTPPTSTLESRAGHWWHTVTGHSAEHAVLLACPAPAHDIHQEAAWRFIGHVVQPRFYQRMRVELQLGYAVFSSIRQVAGRSTLVFGIQSPSVTTAGILGHLEEFLALLPSEAAALTQEQFTQQQRALADQFLASALDSRHLSEALWSAHLGGYSLTYLDDLREAILALQPDDIQHALQALRSAYHGWTCLANHVSTETHWLTL